MRGGETIKGEDGLTDTGLVRLTLQAPPDPLKAGLHLVGAEAVTVSADYDDVRLRLVLTAQPRPGPGPGGQVEQAQPGLDHLQLGQRGGPRGEGGAVQLLPQVEQDQVDGPVGSDCSLQVRDSHVLTPALLCHKDSLGARKERAGDST